MPVQSISKYAWGSASLIWISALKRCPSSFSAEGWWSYSSSCCQRSGKCAGKSTRSAPETANRRAPTRSAASAGRLLATDPRRAFYDFQVLCTGAGRWKISSRSTFLNRAIAPSLRLRNFLVASANSRGREISWKARNRSQAHLSVHWPNAQSQPLASLNHCRCWSEEASPHARTALPIDQLPD